MTTLTEPELTGLSDCVRAFETSRRKSSQTRLGDYLPAAGNPERLRTLAELVRVDMEYGWTERRALRLEAYLRDYPELVDDAALLGEVAFEEYRLRCDHGERPRA